MKNVHVFRPQSAPDEAILDTWACSTGQRSNLPDYFYTGSRIAGMKPDALLLLKCACVRVSTSDDLIYKCVEKKKSQPTYRYN